MHDWQSEIRERLAPLRLKPERETDRPPGRHRPGQRFPLLISARTARMGERPVRRRRLRRRAQPHAV
jgi:hypothetical protein